MKKIVFILIVLLSFSACQQTDNKKEKPKTTKKKEVKGLIASPGIELLIVINTDVFTGDELKVWEDENKVYYSAATIEPATCTSCNNKVAIDLSKISDNNEVLANWLRENTDNICYQASYPLIEKDHNVSQDEVIKPAIDLALANINPVKLHITLKELIDKIANYDVLNYQKYINFSIQKDTDTPVFESVCKFKRDKFSFSIPSIKSIVAVNKIKPEEYKDYSLDIVKIKCGGRDSLGFTFSKTDSAGTIKILNYYDYSTDPTGGGRINCY